ncbi:MAG: T9SS type A sorting domain-containing protein, partial [Bacteroidota bacterium]
TSLSGPVYGPWIYPQGYFNSQGMSGTPLPVTLIDFTVSSQRSSVVITWQTATEIDNDYFMIERSVDGVLWEELMKVDGAGTSSGPINYRQTDRSPHTGLSFYRLKQVDFDRQFSYSSIKWLDRKEDYIEKLRTYPNPATNETFLAGSHGNTKIRLMDINGREMNDAVKMTYRNELISIDVSKLPVGVYFIRAGNGLTKLIKQ